MNEDKVDLNETVDKEAVNAAARRVLKIPPSTRRVLEMTDEILLNNYALIMHKGSSLSSAQRRMVEQRVAFGVNEKRFTMEQVTESVNDLTTLIEKEMEKELKLNE